jgi:hypothetical protein
MNKKFKRGKKLKEDKAHIIPTAVNFYNSYKKNHRMKMLHTYLTEYLEGLKFSCPFPTVPIPL